MRFDCNAGAEQEGAGLEAGAAAMMVQAHWRGKLARKETSDELWMRALEEEQQARNAGGGAGEQS